MRRGYCEALRSSAAAIPSTGCRGTSGIPLII